MPELTINPSDEVGPQSSRNQGSRYEPPIYSGATPLNMAVSAVALLRAVV